MALSITHSKTIEKIDLLYIAGLTLLITSILSSINLSQICVPKIPISPLIKALNISLCFVENELSYD